MKYKESKYVLSLINFILNIAPGLHLEYFHVYGTKSFCHW